MPVMTDHEATGTGPPDAQEPADPTQEPAADARDESTGDDEIVDLVDVESDEVVTDESTATDEGVTGVGRAGRLPSRRTLAVAVPLVALLGATGFLGWTVWNQHQIDQAREQAQRTAVSYAQVLTSIDSNKVDENFQQVLDGATGEFKDLYSQSSVELRQLLIENKATARGVVVDSAVQSVSKDRAVVLLFVDQSVANTKLPDPRIDRSRMKMTLEKVDGSWRASKVELP